MCNNYTCNKPERFLMFYSTNAITHTHTIGSVNTKSGLHYTMNKVELKVKKEFQL